MVKEKYLKILITSRNITYYKNIGYNFIQGNTYEIKFDDINQNSHSKITAICEKCGSENYITIEKYYKNKNNHNYYGCKKCSREKFKLTSNILFGKDNPMQNITIKENKIVVLDNEKKSVLDFCEGVAKQENKKIEVEYLDEIILNVESFGQIKTSEILKKSISALKEDLEKLESKIK
jgi:hypothetical protein